MFFMYDIRPNNVEVFIKVKTYCFYLDKATDAVICQHSIIRAAIETA